MLAPPRRWHLAAAKKWPSMVSPRLRRLVRVRTRHASSSPAVTIRHLGRRDPKVLDQAVPGLFAGLPDRARAAEYLRGAHQHLVVALVDGRVVGFASGVHCRHPDRPPDLFVDAVAVARGHRRGGLGRKLLEQLLAHACALGCVRAWAVFDGADRALGRVYAAVGGRRRACALSLVEIRLLDGRGDA
jgi:aminoglycoside 6'-N-acetyltransferase I